MTDKTEVDVVGGNAAAKRQEEQALIDMYLTAIGL